MRGVVLCVGLGIAAVLAGGGAAAATDYAADAQRTIAWAERAFAARTPDRTPRNRLVVVHEDGAGETKLRRCNFGGPLRLGERVYEHGIGVNSHSVLRVSLAEPAREFAADIGLDRNVDGSAASVRFQVLVAGETVFETEVMRPGDPVQSIEVPLSGAQEFDLVVDTGGDNRYFDQGDWGDARVTLASGAVLWLDELDFTPSYLDRPPFSFVYGGKPSSELLSAWEQSVDGPAPGDGPRTRTLTLRDPATGLEVRAVCTLYTDVPGVDWTLYFTNTGTADSPVLEAIRSLDVVIPDVAEPVLHQLEGSIAGATDWRPFSQGVADGHAVTIQPQSGRSSKGASPFFTCAWQGGGVVTAIGWTGRWTASVEHSGQTLRLQAGLEKFRAKLRPGETVRGPRILQVYWQGDDVWYGYNAFRQVMLRHIMPKIDGQPVVPPIAHMSTSFYEMDDGTEADVMAHLESAKGLGFEYFWLDAYRGITRFPVIGHYVLPVDREVDKNRFPNGLAPISRAAHDAGMKFLLWFEPERISPGSLMDQEHPEWVVMPPPERMGHGGMINLAIPEARQYATEYLNAAIDAYGIECLRIDNAVDYDVLWGILDERDPDRAGIDEVRYVEGLYRMWDDLLAAHPGLFIDNCASGGQRIDLELCARSIPLWRTDGTIIPLLEKNYAEAALRNQVITAGLNRYLPFHTSGQMGVTPYLFRSGFNGGMAFSEDIRAADYPRDQLAAAIAEGKRIQKYYPGDFYALSDVSIEPSAWLVMQYHLAGSGEGMVLAFRRPASPYTGFACPLRGIRPDAEYDVTVSRGYVPEAPVRMTGAELANFDARIEEAPGSLLMEYRVVE